MSAMRVKTLFKKYLKDLSDVSLRGDAREESFYPTLAGLLQEVSESTGRTHVHVTTLPKPTEAGNPDFRLWNGTDRIIGYIEAKRPTEERLDLIEGTDQLQRYRSTFPNLILTNFLEFRLYRNGERIETVLCGRPVVLNKLGMAPPMEKQQELFDLLDRFLDFSLPKAYTAETLAVELAKRTRFLRDIVLQEIQGEQPRPGALTGFYEAFEKYLIGDLAPLDFADLYAQTIAYGLFAARTRAQNGFNRRSAFDSIPRTIGVLRDLFRFISFGDLPEPLAWCVDDIAEVLAVADAPGILDRYFHEGKGSDPIVHFYETFLSQYDPAERERRGVYYTPETVVGYIVRSLHGLLKSAFNKPDGLASQGVTLLDPAAGTMTFVAQAAQKAAGEFASKYGTGARDEFIRRHILQNFYAFELMMAPYAVGHLKMGFFLEELGHRLADDERIPFYLTNTLDNEELETSRLPGFSSLAEESRLAGKVKKETAILVILGNPPYSGHSSNTGPWIRGLIDDYKQVDGKPLGEKNPKWLQDDYVKFLRFAQWKIEQAGRGVVGMITNHGYLDNPTFRGMRQSLMKTFDAIYILDLHGNSLKKEICPDGSPDQNVFDIRQGVAIAFFVKNGKKKKSDAVVRHAEVWGLRAKKYDWLDGHSLGATQWSELKPTSPFYLFVPRDNALAAVYQTYPSVHEIFQVNSVGIVTARDKLTIGWTKEEIWQRARLFSQMDPEMAREAYGLGKDARDWKVEFAQKDLLDSGPTREKVVPVLYRPFDIRHTYYTGHSRGFLCMPRPEVMSHMLSGENIALLVSRQVISDFRHTFVSNKITNFNNIDTAGRFGSGYNLPLYLYPATDHGDLFAHLESTERQPNLDQRLIAALAEVYGRQSSPEKIFYYIYAVLYAPAYRQKYAEFLRMDFPRIPFTSDGELFLKMAGLGERLTGLHLLKSDELNPPACRFEGEGDKRVGKGKKEGLRYDPAEQRVYINATQYFAPVPEDVWTYRIGGYQVCEKWLKDRQGRRLELDDIRTYCQIVTALKLTIDIQGDINLLYPGIEIRTLPSPFGTHLQPDS
jgi:hypothetical protein